MGKYPGIIDGDSITSRGVDYLVFADRASLYCVNNTTSSPEQAGVFELRRIVDPAAGDSNASLLGGIYARNNILYVTAGRGNLYLYRTNPMGAGATLCGTSAADWGGRCTDTDGDPPQNVGKSQPSGTPPTPTPTLCGTMDY